MKKIIKPGREDVIKTSWSIQYRTVCQYCGCEFTYDDLERFYSHNITTGATLISCPHCGRQVVEQFINYNQYGPEYWTYEVSGGNVEHEEEKN